MRGYKLGRPMIAILAACLIAACSTDGSPSSGKGIEPETTKESDALESLLVAADLFGHNARVSDIAMAADGKIAVSGGEDNLLRVWDLATRRRISEFGMPKELSDVAVNADGSIVAALTRGDPYEHNSAEFRLWKAETGELLDGFATNAAAIDLNAAGTLVAIAGGGWVDTETYEGLGRVMLRRGGETTEFPAMPGWVGKVELSAQGHFVVSSSVSMELEGGGWGGFGARLWKTDDGALVAEYNVSDRAESGDDDVRLVGLSRDGELVASIHSRWIDYPWTEAHTLRVWDARSGELVCAPFDLGDNAKEMRFARAGWVLLLTDADVIRGFEVSSCRPTVRWSVPTDSSTFDWANGRVLVGTQQGALHLFDATPE